MNPPHEAFLRRAAEAEAASAARAARAAPEGGSAPDTTARIGVSRPHESAHLHVAGAAPYIDDLPETAGTLHAALGLPPVAHGTLRGINLATLRAQPGVVAVLTAADIPGPNDCGPIIHDDPILAVLGQAGTLHHVGQPVFAVIATSREAARRAAALAPQV
ncbi:MAG: xanthine dehydrogenase molybdopterin binding subunit, partial [Microbacteriaceae bacterium]|nr:xanthine dehydrogenase molybdopterin binding subunit [Burkholderiaceae bacterium]